MSTCRILLDKALERPDEESVAAVTYWLKAGWDLAAPLMPYDQLASHHGHPAERAATLEAVLDLRQPMYDARLLFVREDSAAARRVLRLYDEERQELAPEECALAYCGLPFLRTVWAVKPKILALPMSWVKEKGRDDRDDRIGADKTRRTSRRPARPDGGHLPRR